MAMTLGNIQTVTEIDEVKPDDNQIMELADFQTAFVTIGEFFTAIRHLFASEKQEIINLATGLVNTVKVYISDKKQFKMFYSGELHERLEINKLIVNTDFVLPPTPSEAEIDKTSITFDTLIKWSRRPFDLIEAAGYFKGQGNKKLAQKIMTGTKIAFWVYNHKVPGIMVKCEGLDDAEIGKVNTMVSSLEQQRKLESVKAYRKQQETIAMNPPVTAEPKEEKPKVSKIIIDS